MIRYHRVLSPSPRALRLWGDVSFVTGCALVVVLAKTWILLLSAAISDTPVPKTWILASITLSLLWLFQYGYRRAL